MKKKRLFVIIAITVFFILNIEPLTSGMIEGMHTCINYVIPSLFIFIILSNIVTSLLLDEETVSLSPKLTAFFLGNLCGFPVGATVCDRFCKNGYLSAKEASAIIPFCNNASPAFILGVVGVSLLHNRTLGWILLIAQILSSLLPLVLIKIEKKEPQIFNANATQTNDVLFDAIESAISQILRVCAIICIFSAICAFLEEFNPFPLSLILEITNGAKFCATRYQNHPLQSFVLIGFLCGFSGLCVHAQIISLVKHFKVDIKKLFISKIIQGLICAIFCAIGYILFF